MVADSSKAGAVIRCPNCSRSLRVPSGKGRGKELAPDRAAARTSRQCPQCGRSVPVDAQVCPHCRTALADDGTPVAEAATPGADAGPEVIYGGSRATWWTRLTVGAKVSILIGVFVFAVLLTIIGGCFVYPSWYRGQVAGARERARQVLAEGRQLECRAKLQEAYNLYYSGLNRAKYLKSSGDPGDLELLNDIESRAYALEFVVAEPKTREPTKWKPKNKDEFDQALVELRASYPTYRQYVLKTAGAGLAAIETGESSERQVDFDTQVGLAMDAFIELLNETTPPQRAQHSFQVLFEAIRELGGANRNWDDNRKYYLASSKARFEAVMELVQKPGYPDAVW